LANPNHVVRALSHRAADCTISNQELRPMKRRSFTVGSAVCLLILSPGLARATDEVPEDKLATEIVGTWRMISAKYAGQENDLPKQFIALKHVTPVHMTWLRIEGDTGNVVALGGGPYTLSGKKLVEKPTYGLGIDDAEIKGKTHTFTCKIIDGRWHHTGQLENGLTIEEVYERVKNEEPAEAPAEE
jgi:hypothetical protein